MGGCLNFMMDWIKDFIVIMVIGYSSGVSWVVLYRVCVDWVRIGRGGGVVLIYVKIGLLFFCVVLI